MKSIAIMQPYFLPYIGYFQLMAAEDKFDVIFMSMFTVHRSSTNGTEGKYRLAVSTRFDNADEKIYVERCYPSAYERTVHRKQYFSDFPSREQVDAVFRLYGKN